MAKIDADLLTLAAMIARRVPDHTDGSDLGTGSGAIGQDCAALGEIAGKLHRLAEHDCNYGLTPRQQKRRERLEAKAREIAKGWRVPIEFQGDPRGRPISLDLGGPSNSWGGGWRI